MPKPQKQTPLMLAVLRWLAQQPPAVYDFAVVADSIGQHRNRVETTVRELQRRGVLETRGPKGERLRARHVYLVNEDERKAALAAPGAPVATKDAARLAEKAKKQIAARRARDDREAMADLERAEREKRAQQDSVDDFNRKRAARRAALTAAIAEKEAARALRTKPTAALVVPVDKPVDKPAEEPAPKPAPNPAPAAPPPVAPPAAAPPAAAPPKAPKVAPKETTK